MDRVLLLSHTTGYQLRAFNDAAEQLGIELMFATDRCHKLDDPWQDRAIPVRFHDLDASVAAIVDVAGRMPVHGVIAVGDRPVVLAARAAHALGLTWHSVAGAAASTDKCRSRTVLAAAGLPAPGFRLLRRPMRDSGSGMQDSGLRMPDSGLRMPDSGSGMSDQRFPCVLKPLGLSGSRGVIRADNPAEFEAAFRRLGALLARPDVRAARTGLEDEILVEEYIDGREFALEGVLTAGALRVFALFDKPDPMEGPFFEETVYVTPSRLPPAAQAAIVEHVHRASHALGLSDGPVHAECRLTADGTVYVLEVAARPIGGLCSRVLAFTGSERSLEGVLLQHALGRSIAHCQRRPEAAAVMMIPIASRGMYRGVAGEAAARQLPGVTDLRVTAKVGQVLETLPEAGSYLGFIFSEGRTPAEAEAVVRQAHLLLSFDIAPEIPLVRG